MHVILESPDQPDIRRLIDALDAYQRALYPPASTHLLALDALMQPNVLFAVARDDMRRAVGCGAVVLESSHGELKRMYVDPSARGKGVAKAVLTLLEAQARVAGCRVLMLETGPLQPEALALYASSGFERRGPYGSYWEDPFSVFMQKRLAP